MSAQVFVALPPKYTNSSHTNTQHYSKSSLKSKRSLIELEQKAPAEEDLFLEQNDAPLDKEEEKESDESNSEEENY